VVSTPIAAPKPQIRRVTRVIGFAIVAVGVSILFLPVSGHSGVTCREVSLWG
jgi:hypothetical protein